MFREAGRRSIAPNAIARQITREINVAIPPRPMRSCEKNSNRGKAPPLSYDETEKPKRPVIVTREAKIRARRAGLRSIAIFIMR